MDAHLFLKQGVLRLEPLNFGVSGGEVRSTIRMNASETPIRTRADIALRGLSIAGLMPKNERTKDAAGKVGGNIPLATTGNSIAACAATPMAAWMSTWVKAASASR